MSYLPCGVYHERYSQDHAWWQTNFVRLKMIVLGLVVYVVMPLWADAYYLGVANMVGYTVLGALGVQLLIGYCGQVTLGHAAFLAVGAYTSTLLILQVPWPAFLLDAGLAYPISILVAALVAGVWSRSVRAALGQGQGFLPDPDHHGRPVHHRGLSSSLST